MSTSPSPARPRFHRHRDAGGVALVIVLAFVALLTGLLVAFLSRTITDRQIANSSAGDTRTRLFAEGAVDTIVSDFKQEIAAGSNATQAGTATLYVPKAPANAVPALALHPALDQNKVDPGTENLLKRSVRQTPFDGPGKTGAKRAADLSTLAASLNGRSVSPARWNKPLLLAKAAPTSDTDLTPVGATATTWDKAPDWVLVTRDGSVPTTWTGDLTAGPNKDRAVVGRYAYQIYDEGGLLDVNAAGYPSTAPAPNSPVANLAAYKASLAFADLTQLPGIAALSAARRNALRDALVGWRNYASAQPANAFPDYSFDPTQAAGYLSFAANHPHGFLAAGNAALFNGQSDRLFGSRQELLKLLLGGFASQGATGTGKTERANLQNALQHLATFSRDLNQPSHVRIQSVNSTAAGYDAGAPKVLAAGAGGNNATGLDSAINPSFLTTRVKTAFTRNDGSLAVVSPVPEPLVKQRFNLNRLAWLTCKGPSATRSLGESDMAQLIANGLTSAFLAQGTDANIQKYFGLTWDTAATPPGWRYVHGRSGSSGPIMKLNHPGDSNDVVRANREPDFFELLKAAVNVGSIAKTLTASGAGTTAYQAQYNADVSVDYAIMQIGANIVDQFDTDGFPTRIAFDDGSGGPAREFRGVENLPYLYRVRDALIKVAAPTLVSGNSPYTPLNSPNNDYPLDPTGSIANTGVGAFMQYPDIWNPHDWNAGNLNQTFGFMGPTQFRIYATSLTNFSVNAHTGGTAPGANNSVDTNGSPTDQAASPGYNSLYGFSWAGEQRSLTQANTEMTFQVNRDTIGAGLFREPTILFQPGKPTGSGLTSTAISNKNGLGVLTGGPFFAGGGIRSDVDTLDGTGLPQRNAGYIGFYLGAHPLQWRRGSSVTPAGATIPGTRYGARQTSLSGTATVTYSLQCQDASGQWATYDEKKQVVSGNPDDHIMRGPEWGFIHNQGKFGNMTTVMDPRTARFNLMATYIFSGYGTFRFPPWTSGLSNDGSKTAWLNKAESILLSNRNGYAGGVVIHAGAGSTRAMGWYPGGWEAANGNSPTFQIGWFSQNDPNLVPERNLSDQLGGGSDGTPGGVGPSPIYYADPDGVVRRAAAGYNTRTAVLGGSSTTAAAAPGLPMATAHTNGTTRTGQGDSRPIILNRPFRSVSELGYVMSATPWKNLNFFLPESGDAALLDVFTTQDTDEANALVAGRVNLNTRQVPVLQAILAGAYRDEWNPGSTTLPGGASALAQKIAQQLVTRTTAGPPTGPNAGKPTPLANVSELVGKWVSSTNTPLGAVDGSKSYDGFSADLSAVLPAGNDAVTQRFREATLRALAGSGQTRVWNLMIDLVAQTGRYPQTATALDKFVVEGEQRYWVHVAIDRATGTVIDKQIEVVKE